jgi:hypothetical protein
MLCDFHENPIFWKRTLEIIVVQNQFEYSMSQITQIVVIMVNCLAYSFRIGSR